MAKGPVKFDASSKVAVHEDEREDDSPQEDAPSTPPALVAEEEAERREAERREAERQELKRAAAMERAAREAAALEAIKAEEAIKEMQAELRRLEEEASGNDLVHEVMREMEMAKLREQEMLTAAEDSSSLESSSLVAEEEMVAMRCDQAVSAALAQVVQLQRRKAAAGVTHAVVLQRGEAMNDEGEAHEGEGALEVIPAPVVMPTIPPMVPVPMPAPDASLSDTVSAIRTALGLQNGPIASVLRAAHQPLDLSPAAPADSPFCLDPVAHANMLLAELDMRGLLVDD